MDRQTVILRGEAQRVYARRLLETAPPDSTITFAPRTRSLDQNAKLWPMLADVSRQVAWYGRHLSPEEWKHVFTASLSKMDVVPNLDGTGFVALGQSTSAMGVRQFAALIELIYAFGAERGVRWSEQVAA